MKQGTKLDNAGQNDWTAGTIAEIAKYKQQGLTIREIADKVGKSKSRVHQLIQKHKIKGTGQRGSGVLDKGPLFQIHNYQVTVDILEKPTNWSPNLILMKRKVRFDCIERNMWQEYVFPYQDFSIHITPYKMIIFPPHIESRISPYDAKAIASAMALELLPKLELEFEIKLSRNLTTLISVKKQHVVLMCDAIWDKLKELGFEYLKDSKGNVRLILDQSDGKHIEGIHPLYADSDIDRLDGLFLEVINEGYTFTKMAKAIENSAITVNKWASTQQEYGENIKTHIGAIKTLGEGVNKLTSILERMEKKIK